jgi:16S rRNA (adenine1518-N6/adenine1519-N6)-dimethyltransferase
MVTEAAGSVGGAAGSAEAAPSVSEARASLERLERHGIRPNRELGQNFLADDNILGLIGRTAELTAQDVVLEIGGGLGILSSHLAGRVAHLHVVEADPRLEPALDEALAGRANAAILIADVMDLDLGELDPRPGKVVANLPYGVAVPAILKTIEELPGTDLWCVMVQREVADRLAGSPGTKAYGVPSVLVQLACRIDSVRPISRNVFRPVPRVDSALVRMRRTGRAAPPGVRSLVRAGFAHRRKALAGSLRIAGGGRDAGGGREARDRARAALEAMGHPPDERAERLAPQEFVDLAARLEWA